MSFWFFTEQILSWNGIDFSYVFTKNSASKHLFKENPSENIHSRLTKQKEKQQTDAKCCSFLRDFESLLKLESFFEALKIQRVP